MAAAVEIPTPHTYSTQLRDILHPEIHPESEGAPSLARVLHYPDERVDTLGRCGVSLKRLMEYMTRERRERRIASPGSN